MVEGPAVKICGLRRREDVEAADVAGADYVGVVLTAGFLRSVDPAEAGPLVESVSAVPVAVLVDEDADVAQARAEALGAGVVQLHGREDPALVAEVARRGPWAVWKAVRVSRPGELLDAVERYGEVVDGLLLEGRKEGVVGGGGATLDVERLRDVRLRLAADLRIVLAGGLTPETVRGAADRFHPDVVDVSSGVEREPGEKDADLIRRFISAARRDHPPPPRSRETTQ